MLPFVSSALCGNHHSSFLSSQIYQKIPTTDPLSNKTQKVIASVSASRHHYSPIVMCHAPVRPELAEPKHHVQGHRGVRPGRQARTDGSWQAGRGRGGWWIGSRGGRLLVPLVGMASHWEGDENGMQVSCSPRATVTHSSLSLDGRKC